jgi:hypothetical protein
MLSTAAATKGSALKAGRTTLTRGGPGGSIMGRAWMPSGDPPI